MDSPPRIITKKQHLELLGLFLLAERQRRTMKMLLEAALEITEEKDGTGAFNESGHTADAIYGEHELDTLLKKLNITIEE